MKKPYASDWAYLCHGVEYSQELDLYWFEGRVYDERSARHNGIIGAGRDLRQIIKEN